MDAFLYYLPVSAQDAVAAALKRTLGQLTNIGKVEGTPKALSRGAADGVKVRLWETEYLSAARLLYPKQHVSFTSPWGISKQKSQR